jgi:prepilin-type N-terminal cleavage/methylation domain-containing protein
MSASTKGFTLIELLVVIAILAVLSTISINSYSGYIESSAQKAAENSLRAMSIAQQEYKSNYGSYFPTSGATGTCAPTTTTTANIITTLFGGIDNLTSQRYNFCTTGDSASYTLVAKHKTATCQLSLTNFNILTPSGCDV